MIQIDDAGWGSLLGSTIIGAYRVETAEFMWEELPIAAFQGTAFARKAYLEEAVLAARLALQRLAATPEEKIECCSGYVLAAVRDDLHTQGYAVQVVRVVGPLQEKIEAAFRECLRRLGFECTAEVQAAPGKLFYQALKWLKGGNVDACMAVAERERWAKTGWATYRIWVEHPYKLARWLAAQHKQERRRHRGQGCED